MVLDQLPAGTADWRVAEIVKAEQRALLTLDLDFADIRAYPPAEYFGIVVLRIRNTSSGVVLPLIERLAAALAAESPDGSLWIVDEDRIRIR